MASSRAVEIGDEVIVTEGVNRGRKGTVANVLRTTTSLILYVRINGIPDPIGYDYSAVKPSGMRK